MRLILICLTALLLLIQFPLWLGKGGWLRVWELDKQVVSAQKKNDELKARNAKLDSEVQDLKQGTGAVEERARFELGMIKDNEIFVQVLDPARLPAAAPGSAMPTLPPGAGATAIPPAVAGATASPAEATPAAAADTPSVTPSPARKSPASKP